ncbi:Decapping enzyme complex, predicted pyrophosphatase DCP2 [Pseudoloma neurophilia]|uniref:Decapping enzyme complex, predicted pyrophosphatase DCP2 n=1 Tax=Pseudoloma neurophilia TaxID=146866 RepID=A0A0R0M1I3_9MICR|nr:Decapping enzyme complex, predicted pyrophosphatase DCP2 [Pseudoloma neurophilia]
MTKQVRELKTILDEFFSDYSSLGTSVQSELSSILTEYIDLKPKKPQPPSIIKAILDEILFRFFLDITPIEIHPIRLFFILEEAHWFLIDFFPKYKKMSFASFVEYILKYILQQEQDAAKQKNNPLNYDINLLKSLSNNMLEMENSETPYNPNSMPFEDFATAVSGNFSRETLKNTKNKTDDSSNDQNTVFRSANQPLPRKNDNLSAVYMCTTILKNLNFYLKSFSTYKQSISVFACLILNDKMDHVLLNKGYGKNAQLQFPRGKKSFNETGKETAIRETYEEIGLDVSLKIMDIMFLPKKEKYHILIVINQPTDTFLQAQTRFEIKDIEWVSFSEIMGTREDLQSIRTVFIKIQKYLDYLKSKRVVLDREKILRHFDYNQER